MKKIKNIGIISYSLPYSTNNGIFNKKEHLTGENLEYRHVLLKETLKKINIDINTIDMMPLENFDLFLCFDFPTTKSFPIKTTIKELYDTGKSMYLIQAEPEMFLPENWNISNLVYFKKVFTWNDEMADGKKYVKYQMPNKIPKDFIVDINKKPKLCTLIAGNKYIKHPLELFSERIKAIRWFENKHPDDFDLYGYDWYSEIFKRPSVGFFTKLLCHSSKLRESLDKDYYRSWKGRITGSKLEVLSNYKFAICYENSLVPGYITEKIFDCFFVGTIPIYLGAPNVKEYIPENTFIDKRKFSTYEALYEYIANMPSNEYLNYISNIENYVKSERIKEFSAEKYVDIITKNILNSEA